MILSWLDMVKFSYNGFQELAVFLLVFYAYPLYKVIKNEPMNMAVGIVSAIAAAGLSVGYMEWKTLVFDGEELCFAGHGTYIFFFASILLLVGVMKYEPTDMEEETDNDFIPDSTI